MCSCGVDGADEETNTEGSLGWMSGLDLTLLGNGGNESLCWVLASIDILIVDASVHHELAEETSISGHTRDNDTHVIINFENLLLVDSQVVW